MYAWIWRHLPFGLPGKIGGSLLLAAGFAALLWFVIFPWADPWIEQTLLPWDEGQLEGDFPPEGGPGAPNPNVVGDGETPLPEDPFEIPYETE